MVTNFVEEILNISANNDMAEREIYKGIEFIRISKLPAEQKARIHDSFPKDRIIKILKEEVVLNDCIQYHEYQEWFNIDQHSSLQGMARDSF